MNETRPVASLRPLRELLAGAIDYAGLFPPSALDMPSAVRNYRDYRAGEESWALGRLVLQVAALEEFEGVAPPYLPAPENGTPWRLSVIGGPDAARDADRIRAFNDRYRGAAVVDSVEVRASSVDEIGRLSDAYAANGALFVELPLGADLDQLAGALGGTTARAKIRTGGLTPESIPSPADVARFLFACARARIAFKATAGLHHPVRAEYALTYEPGSVRGTMFGYLNVFLAATLAFIGASEDEVTAALQLTEMSAVAVGDDSIAWGDVAVPADAITMARAAFALGFGSCSFREPLDELASLRRV